MKLRHSCHDVRRPFDRNYRSAGRWPACSILASTAMVAAASSTTWGQPFYAANGRAYCVTSADLDWDGDLDLIVGSNQNIDVFLNAGDGTFTGPTETLTGFVSRGIAAGDLNGDQRMDIVLGGGNNGSIGVLIGNGDGTFQDVVAYPVSDKVHDVVLGDIDGDGDLDVASACETTWAEMCWLANDGNGVLSGGTTHRIFIFQYGRSSSIACGDLDNDGDLDLALTYQEFEDPGKYYNAICSDVLLFNDGVGWAWAQQDHTSTISSDNFSGPISAVTLMDLEGDGDLDVFHQVYSSSKEDNTVLEVLVNRGDRQFRPGHLPILEKGDEIGHGLAAGDMRNDGRLDLMHTVQSYTGDRTMLWWIHNVSMYVLDPVLAVQSTSHHPPVDQLVADLNGDGALDSVTVCGDGLLVVLNPFPPLGPTLEINSMIRGETANFSLSDAPPAKVAYFLYSQGEPGYTRGIRPLGGMSLNLTESFHILGSQLVDANGEATLAFDVPIEWPSDAITVQAVIRIGPGGDQSQKSNLVYTTVQE